jgi:hypothetical protein
VIESGEEIGLEYREDVNNLPPGAGDSIGWCQQTRGGPLLSLAVALTPMLEKIEADLAAAGPTETGCLRQRAELLRELLAPRPADPLPT